MGRWGFLKATIELRMHLRGLEGTLCKMKAGMQQRTNRHNGLTKGNCGYMGHRGAKEATELTGATGVTSKSAHGPHRALCGARFGA